ncbi:ATP phosphoribosyltransferase [Basidiobolus meristosporus CBS 931.73]|uniref:ATP phosphoribosyltransferase n=1 Tax=Basidiobolus meristosporus CBS 931.73 TaxID=1314790 RepID=A0A1Y1XYM8_9FUNG|nr:ATP phosphoribosyltransferase [Basidiobolus meristosporus CBS 931.73]|eukprot:ORX90464.1 ATP phosphoribosyltransferase [Basidiobolus meristosporus CBS 931.73]
MELIPELTDRLLFAIPKKGRLHEKCLQLLKGADIQFHKKARLDVAIVRNLPIALVFLPAADIATFVGQGNVDLGITGEDIIAESDVHGQVEKVMDLGFGKCRLCIQVPVKGEIKKVEDLVGKRIVTSFEGVSRRYFDGIDATVLSEEEIKANKGTKITCISGSVEAACTLGLADGIVDLVESGETMHAAGLHDIATILTTEAVLISRKSSKHVELISKLKSRIEGVIAATKYVYINYNVDRNKLKEATKITPGRKAPTVSPLENDGWVAVSSMVLKADVADIMDELKHIGATDIMVFNINNCRV